MTRFNRTLVRASWHDATRRDVMRPASRRSDAYARKPWSTTTTISASATDCGRGVRPESAGGFCDFLKNGGYQARILSTAPDPSARLEDRGGSRIASVFYGRRRPATRFRRTSRSYRTFAKWSVSCFVRSTILRSCLSFWLLFPLYHACPIMCIFLL